MGAGVGWARAYPPRVERTMKQSDLSEIASRVQRLAMNLPPGPLDGSRTYREHYEYDVPLLMRRIQDLTVTLRLADMLSDVEEASEAELRTWARLVSRQARHVIAHP
jgi:hypothetical protein